MRAYVLESFGFDGLQLHRQPLPEPGPDEVRVELRSRSLNFRDLLVVLGGYNPRLALPAIPLSDAAGVVSALGSEVDDWALGDEVLGHFLTDWAGGPYHGRYLATTLGTPGPGMAAESVVLPARALVSKPATLSFREASTLPIAALTAWSALVSEGGLTPENAASKTVLSLGTGGVSLFALQIAKAFGARVLITSSSDEKLERARAMGADLCINYRSQPDWDRVVVEHSSGGADIVVENGGAETLSKSLRATKAGGVVGMLGALTGLRADIDIAPILMKRIRVAGILVDHREAFREMCAFIERQDLHPVIDSRFALEELVAAFHHLKSGRHFGKIVIADE